MHTRSGVSPRHTLTSVSERLTYVSRRIFASRVNPERIGDSPRHILVSVSERLTYVHSQVKWAAYCMADVRLALRRW